MRYIFKKIFLKTKFFLNSYNIACPLDYRQNHFDLSNILKLKGEGGGWGAILPAALGYDPWTEVFGKQQSRQTGHPQSLTITCFQQFSAH